MPETSNFDSVSTRQQRIAELARQSPQMGFTSLNHHLDLTWLHEAYRRTRKDGAVGVDGQTAADYEANLQDNLQGLLDRAKSGTYRAPPVRRVHIPKGTRGDTRPIGIPTFEDKVLQRAVVMVLEALYEQDFYDCSYGFRPGRSAHDALQALWEQTMGIGGGWILEVDIRKFLETSSYYTPFHEGWSKRPGWLSKILIRKPLPLPRRTCTAASSPRFTRCKTVCREAPSNRVATCMATYPGGGSSTKRSFQSSATRIRQGAPGVVCSPAMNPSLSHRWTVEGAAPRICAAFSTVTSWPSGGVSGGR